jgi:hypothetical protein
MRTALTPPVHGSNNAAAPSPALAMSLPSACLYRSRHGARRRLASDEPAGRGPNGSRHTGRYGSVSNPCWFS